ncbi:MAG: VIT1/CCC1 transporter family protein [Deltaproteobacteria bacterium]|nr:VIT1/CCC1 transporter family protein [Deltaproteobacteria bacterium]
MMEVAAKRERIERRGRIREIVFGMQDGILSTVAFLAGLQAATPDARLILLGGLVQMFSGAVSMAAGAYLSTKAEEEVYEKEVREEVRQFGREPYLAQEQLLHALGEEGLSRQKAYQIVKLLRDHEEAFLKTFQEKVLGLGSSEAHSPGTAALTMGLAFPIGGIIPLFPYIVTTGLSALAVSVGLGALALFAVGAVKARLTHRSPWASGLEFLAIAMGAGIVGHLFGLLLPQP